MPRSDPLERFLAGVAEQRLLSDAEESELARRIESGDLAAKERLITHNIGLVVSIARRYQGADVALTDLIQEGMVGLIRAAGRFDRRRGDRFSAYAKRWIRQSIVRTLSRNSCATGPQPAVLADREVAAGFEEDVLRELSRDAVRRAVADLPEPDREVIRRHYGIESDRTPETCTAIARTLGVSPQRVRTIERRALAALADRGELAELASVA